MTCNRGESVVYVPTLAPGRTSSPSQRGLPSKTADPKSNVIVKRPFVTDTSSNVRGPAMGVPPVSAAKRPTRMSNSPVEGAPLSARRPLKLNILPWPRREAAAHNRMKNAAERRMRQWNFMIISPLTADRKTFADHQREPLLVRGDINKSA